MKQNKWVNIASVILLSFSALAILMVSVMAFQNPQAVMDLVQVTLPNNDAYSSIRGVYGGVGLTITAVLLYCVWKNKKQGLAFAALLWGSYALSRLITINVEGALGAFGTQWLLIESVLCGLALLLLLLQVKTTTQRY